MKKISKKLVNLVPTPGVGFRSVIVALIVVGFLGGITWAAGGFGFGSGSGSTADISAGTSADKGLIGHWPLDNETEKVGSELLTNGDMQLGDVNWSKQTGVTLVDAGGGDYVLRYTGVAANIGAWNSTYTFIAGNTYRISFEIKNYSSGSVKFRYPAQWGTYPNANGVYTFTYTAGVADSLTKVQINANENGSTYDIDNVTVKELKTADTTPYSNHGTVYGATQNADDMTFDGSSDYVSIANNTNQVFGTGDFAYSIWFKTTSSYATLFMKKSASDNNTLGYAAIIAAGQLYGKYSNGTASLYTVGPATMNDNSWHNVIISRSGTSITMYTDGVAGTPATVAYDFTNTDAIVMSGTNKVNGTMKEFRIYNRALSADEVAALYNGGKSASKNLVIGSKSKGLVGEWKLDQASEKVGSELITNGGFDSDASWNKGTNWTISGGTLNVLSSASQYSATSQAIGLVNGKTYYYKFDVTAISGQLIFQHGNNTAITYFTTTGTKTGRFTCTADNNYIRFKTNTVSATGSIDNVIVKELESADATPNANHGTVYGTTQNSDSMSFDGSNDYVDLGNSSIFNPEDGDFTISAWIKSNNTGDYNAIVIKSNGGTPLTTDYGYYFYTTLTDNLSFTTRGSNSATYIITSTMDVIDDTWHHVSVVLDVSTASGKLYIDGSLADVGESGTLSSVGTISNTLNVLIGSESDGGNYFYGNIKDVRIYNRVLSTDEIQSLYDLGGRQNQISTGSLYKGLVLDMPLNSKSERVGTSIITGNDSTIDTVGNWVNDGSGATLTGGYDSGDSDHDRTLRIESGDGSNERAGLANLNLVAGKTYRLVFDYKHIETTSVTNTLVTFSLDGSRTPAVLSSAWAIYIEDFTVVTGGSQILRIYVDDGGGNAANEMWIDNISLKEIQTKDSTPYSNHGVVYGATVGSDSTSFDGINDYILIQNGDWLQLGTGDFSIGGWVNIGTDVNQELYFHRDHTGTPNSTGMFMFRYESTNLLKAYVYEPSAWLTQPTATVGNISGAWHHIMWIRESGVTKIYLDGAAQTVTNASVHSGKQVGSTDSAYDFELGRQSNTGYGDISHADVRIYNRALSTAEVKSLYDKGR